MNPNTFMFEEGINEEMLESIVYCDGGVYMIVNAIRPKKSTPSIALVFELERDAMEFKLRYPEMITQ